MKTTKGKTKYANNRLNITIVYSVYSQGNREKTIKIPTK
jgi:hypothetical protein